MAEFRVTTQTLIDNANNLKEAAEKINTLVTNLDSEKEKALSAWTGDAASAFATRYDALHGDLEQVINDAKRYGTNLEAIANQYAETEGTQESTIGGLETNVFES
ncbi:MAG: WXG100 family type VII secretion target [Lachnospiraceae bacterium]|nr:WXG100 family type VII secretion target [Lachnospiraceae bacterium]